MLLLEVTNSVGMYISPDFFLHFTAYCYNLLKILCGYTNSKNIIFITNVVVPLKPISR